MLKELEKAERRVIYGDTQDLLVGAKKIRRKCLG